MVRSHSDCRPSACRQTGFTLVELIVVIMLVAILAYSAISRGPDVISNLNVQAEQVAADLRYVQSLSMIKNQRYCLAFGATSYQIRTNSCTSAVPHPLVGTTNVTLANTALTAANLSGNAVEFDGKGAPTTLVSATSNGTVTLTGGGQSKTVFVSPQTGRVFTQ